MYGVVKKGKEEIDKYNMFNDLLIYHYFSSKYSFCLEFTITARQKIRSDIRVVFLVYVVLCYTFMFYFYL